MAVLVAVLSKMIGYLVGSLVVGVALSLQINVRLTAGDYLGYLSSFIVFVGIFALPGYLLARLITWMMGIETYCSAAFFGALTGMVALFIAFGWEAAESRLLFAAFGAAAGLATLFAERKSYALMKRAHRGADPA